ncbi:MFS transporter [Kineosporia sp. R_H_3]|uniref:MFS transporter n=1 Tax=Kineosporia sp. R_H_3 TaxID=1961848 RepID=UPI0018E99229|nr:MFS transporter [Kineosporia sp. R_H_3]
MTTGGTYLGDLRIVLRGRDFRRLFATRLVSQAADGAFQAGLASLFFFSPERAATAGAVAAAFAVAVLPYTLVGPFAGVLLDRWRRRQVLVVANLVRAALVVGVAALVGAGVVGVPLYVAVLVCLSVNRFILAGLGASLPHVVPEDELVMANAVSPTSGTLAALLGGGVGVGVRLALSPGNGTDAVILLLAAAGFAAASQVARLMDKDLLGPDGERRLPWHDVAEAVAGVARGFVDALHYLRHKRRPTLALAAIGGHRLAYGATTVVIILLCRNYFTDPADTDAGAALLASIFVASGVGFFVAALVTPVATRRMRMETWIVVCLVAAALVEATFVVFLDVTTALVGAFVLGTAAQGAKICVDAIVQGSVEDSFRGRVMSFYDVVFNVASVVSAAVCATVLPADGYSPGVYVGITLLYALTAVLYGRFHERR